MAVIKHVLKQPCTRGSYKSRTSAARRTVPRSYPRALGIGLHDTTVQHTAHVRAHLGAYATATPEIMRVRASYRAHAPPTHQAARATSPKGCVGDTSSGKPLRGRKATRAIVPALRAKGGTAASVDRVPVQVPLPDHAAAASKGTPEREWTVRTERSKST